MDVLISWTESFWYASSQRDVHCKYLAIVCVNYTSVKLKHTHKKIISLVCLLLDMDIFKQAFSYLLEIIFKETNFGKFGSMYSVNTY